MYLVFNHTNYGDGIYIVGTLRSKKRALKLIESLERDDDMERGTSWTMRKIFSLDKYTDESILEFAREVG